MPAVRTRRSEFLFTIEENHVGSQYVRLPSCPTCGANGATIHLGLVIGAVLPGDVGKRVFRVDDVIQVENNEQRDARLQRRSPTG